MVYLKCCRIYFTILVELINFEPIRAFAYANSVISNQKKKLCDRITVQQLRFRAISR